MRRKLAAGNWKMNGTSNMLAQITALSTKHPNPTIDVLLCPPATLLSRLSDAASSTAIATGGQTCHSAASGAHTGDISAAMLADAGATYIITGHSERRTDHAETNADVCAQTVAALAAGLTPVVCIGETLAQRDAGETLQVITDQLSNSVPDTAPGLTVIAYEPVWAIGTGKVPTLAQISEVHEKMRALLVARFGDTAQQMRLLYGGSVKASNASDIFAIPQVDGALVGGASLTAEDFSPIISALEAS
jgi:triosephosphate isomerase